MAEDKFDAVKEADIVEKLVHQGFELSPQGKDVVAAALHDELNQFTPRELAQLRLEINKRNEDAGKEVARLARDPNERTLSYLGVASDLTQAKLGLNNLPIMDFIAPRDTIRGVVFAEPGKQGVSTDVTPACGHYKDACDNATNRNEWRYTDRTLMEDANLQAKWRDLY
jgi:hypothetical protein